MVAEMLRRSCAVIDGNKNSSEKKGNIQTEPRMMYLVFDMLL